MQTDVLWISYHCCHGKIEVSACIYRVDGLEPTLPLALEEKRRRRRRGKEKKEEKVK